ncbi:hypothetical protein M8C21_032294, partial [Ambrosia artemisiifolia]
IVKKRVTSKCKDSMLNISIDEYTSEERTEKFKLGEALMEVVTFMDPRKKIRHRIERIENQNNNLLSSSPTFNTFFETLEPNIAYTTLPPPSSPFYISITHSHQSPPPILFILLTTATRRHLSTLSAVIFHHNTYLPPLRPHHRVRQPLRHRSHLHRLSRCLPPSSPSIEDNAIFKLGE